MRKRAIAERLLHRSAASAIVRRGDDGGGLPRNHLRREARPRQRDDRPAGHLVADDVAHERERVALDAFGGHAEMAPRATRAAPCRENRPHVLRRRRHAHELRAGERVGSWRVARSSRVSAAPGEKARVLVLLVHRATTSSSSAQSSVSCPLRASRSASAVPHARSDTAPHQRTSCRRRTMTSAITTRAAAAAALAEPMLLAAAEPADVRAMSPEDERRDDDADEKQRRADADA